MYRRSDHDRHSGPVQRSLFYCTPRSRAWCYSVLLFRRALYEVDYHIAALTGYDTGIIAFATGVILSYLYTHLDSDRYPIRT